MGIFDFLKANEYKAELQMLKEEHEKLKKLKLSVEKMNALELQELVDNKKIELTKLDNEIDSLEKSKETLCEFISKKKNELNVLKKELIDTEDTIELESFGIYKPKYNFISSEQYKSKLEAIRNKQKELIKSKKAVDYFEGWTVDGSEAKGRKMNNDNIKLILRSFNNECEAAINKVKFNNIEQVKKRIIKSFEQLNNLNKAVRISLKQDFLSLKLEEMYLAYEYERKKEEEKEELREQRQREKEEKALQKEIEQKKKVIDKDITHYKNIIDELTEKLSSLSEQSEKEKLNKQIIELHEKIEEKREEKRRIRLSHSQCISWLCIHN